MFQSTRPRGARRPMAAPKSSRFQSTRPRGARRRLHDGRERPVSIHAPARGATRVPHHLPNGVSIHAPARGATCCCTPGPATSFNPRAREGRDSACSTPYGRGFQSTRPRGARRCGRAKRADRVSIHAPARGATCGSGWPSRWSFNPRAREGRDPNWAQWLGILFQSTRPRGARRTWRPAQPTDRFNPRAREGRDACRSRPRDTGRFNPRAREGRDISVLPIPQPINHFCLILRVPDTSVPRDAPAMRRRPYCTALCPSSRTSLRNLHSQGVRASGHQGPTEIHARLGAMMLHAPFP